jgi:hypothetical protein
MRRFQVIACSEIAGRHRIAAADGGPSNCCRPDLCFLFFALLGLCSFDKLFVMLTPSTYEK